MSLPDLSDAEISAFVRQLIAYIQAQHDHYLPMSLPLSAGQKAVLQPFFPPTVIQQAVVFARGRESVSNPPLIAELRSRGFEHAPDLNHLNVVTFKRVHVLQRVTNRVLFHGLVHVTQNHVVGFERCINLSVRAFVKTGRHITIPLHVHAYELDNRFEQSPSSGFSVEDEVRSWFATGRYFI